MHTSVDRALFMLINELTLCMTWYKLNRIRRLNLWKKMYKQFWGKIYCILLVFDLCNRHLTLFPILAVAKKYGFFCNKMNSRLEIVLYVQYSCKNSIKSLFWTKYSKDSLMTFNQTCIYFKNRWNSRHFKKASNQCFVHNFYWLKL